jgi:hypothetical protein
MHFYNIFLNIINENFKIIKITIIKLIIYMSDKVWNQGSFLKWNIFKTGIHIDKTMFIIQ